ncbi:MAG: TIGR03364 family FAD-dependent oxidoreductase [Gordonia sp. (in: high G+C Gram-positive bacteria)]|uniref:TIGR03364 family FAD-dependent oxidoreductase n=1 Tax=Gordonia sp. (in: high G+C Gram-positive bacteria) TaxID=84139 RepID=UPI0039E4842A
MSYDLVVVGAGIVGLGHAFHALERGKSVCVVERADRPVGASIRNFGHASVSAQSGEALEYGRAGRAVWTALAEQAGFWLRETGTYCAARTDAELAVLTEFARGEVLDPDEFARRSGIRTSHGGAWFAGDVQVDPREAAPAIARHLAARGAEFRWGVQAFGARSGVLDTSHGPIEADSIVYAVNHDVTRVLPAAVAGVTVRDCALHMMRVQAPVTLAGPLLTGWSMLRYSGLADLPGVSRVRAELAERSPTGLDLDLHVMATPQRDGTVLLGDTHLREEFAAPFQEEAGFDLLLAEFAALIGTADITVRERWQGVYASSPGREFLCTEPEPGVFATIVTTGIGMTTAFGFTGALADRF